MLFNFLRLARNYSRPFHSYIVPVKLSAMSVLGGKLIFCSRCGTNLDVLKLNIAKWEEGRGKGERIKHIKKSGGRAIFPTSIM